MTINPLKYRKHLYMAAATVLVVAIILLWPDSRQHRMESTAVVERITTWRLTVDGKASLVLQRDTLYGAATWANRIAGIPSSHGTLVVGLTEADSLLYGQAPTAALKIYTERTDKALVWLKEAREELQYYLRTHAVQDEGYNRMAELATQMQAESDSIGAIRATIDSLSKRGRASVAKQEDYRVIFIDDSLRRQVLPLALKKVSTQQTKTGERQQRLRLQTLDKRTPRGARGLNLWPWRHEVEPEFYLTRFAEEGFMALCSLPSSPFRGGDNHLSSPYLCAERDSAKIPSPLLALSDTTNGGPFSILLADSTLLYAGWWSHGKRAGRAIAQVNGRTITHAIFADDTLRWGRWASAEGIYTGEMNAQAIPNGHGTLTDSLGRRYEGAFQNGHPHGFGFAIEPTKPLKVGEWIDGTFKGERLLHSTDRIYGIDIARYQHEQGRRRYAINWPKLRITHLGTISKPQAKGAVGYPIRFIYVKSTEGTTVKNPYYAADYQAARKHGIRTGAYHFFSTKSTGRQQAQYFLRQTKFQRGDLPPVIDIEPTDRQIAAMGGIGVLWREVRVWLQLVERQTGCRPVLYVSQMFVNKYFGEAPDIAQSYQVWMARYNQYKPNVHLLFWQLSPDGRAAGIQTPVDINVFNGYEGAFQDFLQADCVR